MGGYAASVALRAVGAEVPGHRPASFSCLYLGVAGFDDPVDIEVTPVKVGRTIGFHRASITQAGRPIIEAMVASVDRDSPTEHALEHYDGDPPAVGPPLDYPNVDERFAAMNEEKPAPPFKFWLNFEQRPVVWRDAWPPEESLPPTWQCWCRLVGDGAYDDPWLDACRAVILVDVQSWPAAHPPHAYKQLPVYAPSVDLYVAFHEANPWDEWLLTDGHSATAVGGLMGWTGRLWEPSGRLVASGTGQLICRPVRP
jgi:acyl-CoA thioesterase II